MNHALSRLPQQLLIGLLLIAIAWPLSWSGWRPLSEHTFFPLWLGYILTVDGLVWLRSGTSLLTRGPSRFVLLFLLSAPCWWIFELANSYLGNWNYALPRDYGPVLYALLASISFSTVIPAMFETAELMRTFPPFARPWYGPRIAPSQMSLLLVASGGMVMVLLAVVLPEYFFPLIWIGVFVTLDPINQLIGAKSLSAEVARKRWDTVLTLFAASLVCGFFWEMWNVRAMPKWVYDVPHVDWFKIFEMPILGYGGYLPFALELYAFYQLFTWLLFRTPDRYLSFDRPNGQPEPSGVDGRTARRPLEAAG